MSERQIVVDGAAAWERARAAEDLQVGWIASKRLLEEAIAADLDPRLLQKLLGRVRRLAVDVGNIEPTLLQGWGPALPFVVAVWVAREVLLTREEKGLESRLTAAFAELEWEGANE